MGRRGRPSTKEQRDENTRREMEHIWDSWEWILKDKLEGADRIIKQMVIDMSLVGSNTGKSIDFIKPKFYELIKELGE